MPKPSVSTWPPVRIGLGLTVADAGFLLLVALSVAWCWRPLTTVIGRSLESAEYEHYSHIILLPFVSAYLLYLNRHAILEHVHPGLRAGILPAAAGAATIWLAGTTLIAGEPEYQLSLAMLGLVTLWAGGFVLCYGLGAFGTDRLAPRVPPGVAPCAATARNIEDVGVGTNLPPGPR